MILQCLPSSKLAQDFGLANQKLCPKFGMQFRMVFGPLYTTLPSFKKKHWNKENLLPLNEFFWSNEGLLISEQFFYFPQCSLKVVGCQTKKVRLSELMFLTLYQTKSPN